MTVSDINSIYVITSKAQHKISFYKKRYISKLYKGYKKLCIIIN